MKHFGIFLLVFAFSINVVAQKDEKNKTSEKEKTVSSTIQTNDPMDLAKKTFAAHGGEKFKAMKTLVVKGSADISGSPTQTFPATFETIFSGDKYRFELNSDSIVQTGL